MVKRLIPPEEAQQRLGHISKSTFYERFIKTGRLRLVDVTERRRAVVEEELDEVIDEIAGAKK